MPGLPAACRVAVVTERDWRRCRGWPPREVALEIASSVRSGFTLTHIARALPGLETKHAYARRARNPHSLQRDFELTRIGRLQRRPPRHQRRPFRRVAAEIRDADCDCDTYCLWLEGRRAGRLRSGATAAV